MSVVGSWRRELEQLPVELRESVLAATLLKLAERLDSDRGSPSELGKVIKEIWLTLRDIAPPKQNEDALNDIELQRARRIERLSRAADQ